MTPAATTMAALMSEDELLRGVMQMARAFGWRCYHTHDARHSAAGFPDVVMVRDGRLVFAELKRQNGKTTREQDAWLADLAAVGEQHGGVAVFLWRPEQWLDGTVEGVLR